MTNWVLQICLASAVVAPTGNELPVPNNVVTPAEDAPSTPDNVIIAPEPNEAAPHAHIVPPSELNDGPTRLRDMFNGFDVSGTPPRPPMEELGGEAAIEGERETPDYDGIDAKSDIADSLLWVPRIAFAPIWLVAEYGIRTPLVWSLTQIEKNFILERISDALTFLDGDLTLFPRFLADFGLRPSGGISAEWSNFLVPENTINMGFSYGGADFIAFNAEDRVWVLRNRSAQLITTASYLARPDNPFYGFGSRTRTDDERFYAVRRTDASMQLRAFLHGLNRVTFGVHGRVVSFDDDGDNPALRFASLGTPGRYSFDNYQWLGAEVNLEFDSRSEDVQYTGGSGIRNEWFGRVGFDPNDPDVGTFRYGSVLATFLDLTSIHHIIGMRLMVMMQERFSDTPIPVTELASLGGVDTMRGYFQNRFIGESAYEFRLNYRWPVWSLLDAEIFGSLGNAYRDRFRDFGIRKSYLSSGFGLRSNWSREVVLSMLVAVGTNRLDSRRVRVDSTRITFGISKGF